MKVITSAAWRVAGIALLVLAAFWGLRQAHTLVLIVIVACFLALAMIPGVDVLERRFHWKRGLAAGAIILIVFGSIIALTLLLIPAIVDMTGKLGSDIPKFSGLLSKYGIKIGGEATEQSLLASAEQWVKSSGKSKLLSVAGSSVEFIFEFFTVLMFTFLIATDEPRLVRTILRRLSPSRQRKFRLAWRTAKEQTGGYFYSRLLLMVITGVLTLTVMLILGVPTFFAIPLAFFGAFCVEFIPVVGSYLGISIPVLVTLAELGLAQAIILLAWGVIYQQIHDYLLSPRISSKTMSINAGVAFGSALLGASLAGPLGAIFAMPVAGMVTVFLKEWMPAYELDAEGDLVPAAVTAAQSESDSDADGEPG